MTVSIDKLAEFVSANAVKASPKDLEDAASWLLPMPAKGLAPDVVAACILEEFDRRSIGHYRYQGTLMFELNGELFVIHD